MKFTGRAKASGLPIVLKIRQKQEELQAGHGFVSILLIIIFRHGTTILAKGSGTHQLPRRDYRGGTITISKV